MSRVENFAIFETHWMRSLPTYIDRRGSLQFHQRFFASS